jgi:hypothetical protein
MLNQEMVFCKDCFFSKRKSLFNWELICTHKSAIIEQSTAKYNLVTGELIITKAEYRSCSNQREKYYGPEALCGKEAKHYLPKEERARKIFEVERALDGNAPKT